MSNKTKRSKTTGEWLGLVMTGEPTTEEDDVYMENLLHRAGVSKAKVVSGLVYLDGKGTVKCPPYSLQQIAKGLLSIALPK